MMDNDEGIPYQWRKPKGFVNLCMINDSLDE